MSEQSPSAFVFNGIHGRTGKYLLSLTPDQLVTAASGFKLRRGHQGHLQQNALQKGEGRFAVGVGLQENNLSQVGWGIVLPAKKDPKMSAALLDHLKVLIDHRREEAGERLKFYSGADGYLPGETADKFMKRHGGAPGVYDPDENHIPYYVLIVGSPEEIPFSFQYELDATYLVGRLDFGDDLVQYAQYAQSVAAAENEKNGLRLPRRLVLFGTQHLGDSATQQSSEDLVAPLTAKIGKNSLEQGWQLDLVQPDQARRHRLEELLGKGDAPALLFTATHGIGFDAGDPLQETQQGALLCQDFEAYGETLQRDYYLAAEDIADDFKLHGLIAFHFACFGAGTPVRDSFPRVSKQVPKQIASRNFTAALPRRLLSHPKGGALAVIGHVDRAWTYSFKWGEQTHQTATFYDTLARLMRNDRVGVALDSFNLRYAQIALKLTERLNVAEIKSPDLTELGGLWTSNNDARGYALLGDPGVRLCVAKKSETPGERQGLPAVVVAAQPDHAESAPNADPAPQVKPGMSAFIAPEPEIHRKVFQPMALGQASGPVSIKITPQGHITITLIPQGAAGTEPAEAFGGLRTRSLEGDTADEIEGSKSSLQQVLDKFKKTVEALGEKLMSVAGDVGDLKVRTYVSEKIDDVQVENGEFKGDAHQRAMTVIKLDGDTDLVVPVDADQINQALWEIHSKAVEQAQAHRQALLKAIGDLVVGFIPGRE
jgi:hypothetical protein